MFLRIVFSQLLLLLLLLFSLTDSSYYANDELE